MLDNVNQKRNSLIEHLGFNIIPFFQRAIHAPYLFIKS